MKKLIMLLMLTFTANAFADCAAMVKFQITNGTDYRDEYISLISVKGPSYKDMGRDGRIVSTVSFIVTYRDDTLDSRGMHPAMIRKQRVTAECEHAEPSYALDVNGDGVFTLADTKIENLAN